MNKSKVKLPKVVYPFALERQLLTIYLTVVEDTMVLLTKSVLHIFHDAGRDKSIKGIIGKAGKELSGVERTAKAWDRVEWNKLRGIMALPNTAYAKPLQDRLNKLVEDNIGLIQSLPERLISRLETKIKDLPTTGESRVTVQKLLKETGEVGKSRAELIARDQVGKLNGDLTRIRQESLGGTMYIWRTSQDGRVREEHQALDGMVCKWEDPSVYAETVEKAMANEWNSRGEIGGYEGHPGEDYQCRCSAEMVMDDILAVPTSKGTEEGTERIKRERGGIPISRFIPENRSGTVFSRSLKGLSPEEQDRIRALRAARKARKAGVLVEPVPRQNAAVRTEPVVRAEPVVRKSVEGFGDKTVLKRSVTDINYINVYGRSYEPETRIKDKGIRQRNTIRDRIDGIVDKVHKLPKGAEVIDFAFAEFPGATNGSYTAKVNEIRVTVTSHLGSARQTFTHEFGHHLHSELDQWKDNTVLQAIKKTEYFRKLKYQMDEAEPLFGGVTEQYRHLKYLVDDRELFARAYSQYIWEKLDDTEACLAALRNGHNYYIKEIDFASIRKAFDEYFKSKGLSVS